MPRISRPSERFEHTFPWSVFLERDQEVHLFQRKDTILPMRRVTMHGIGMNKTVHANCHMVIVGIAVSRPDAVLTLDVGSAETTYSGPWAANLHAKRKRPPPEHRGTWQPPSPPSPGEDLIHESSGPTMEPLVIPVRQSLGARVKLLPGAPDGMVTVHLRAMFSAPFY